MPRVLRWSLVALVFASGGVATAQPAAVVQAEVTKLRGPLAKEDVSAAFDASPAVAACFEAAPDVDTARITLTVRRSGRVSAAKVTTLDRRRHRGFERCVTAAARAASFDAASRSTTATLTLARAASVTDFLDSVDRDPAGVALDAPAPARAVDVIAAKIHRDYTGGIRRCYNAAIERDATLRGSVTITVDIATDGAVTKATVTGMTAVKRCIEGLAARWQFGPLDTGTAVSVSFNLSP